MTTPSSNDFFTEMGTSPAAKTRPIGGNAASSSSVRPPPPRPPGGGGAAPPVRRAAAPPGARPAASAAGRTTTAGRTSTAGPTSAGRTAATAAGRTSSAGRGSTTAGRTSTAGRTATGARGTTGRGTAGRSRPAGRGTRPASSTTAVRPVSSAAAPAAGGGYYGSSAAASGGAASTHLSSGGAAANPYAAAAPAAAASSDWFAQPPATQQLQQPIANQWQPPAADSTANTANQWQQPSTMQPQAPQQQQQPGANQWQQPSSMQPQIQQQQPEQNLGSNFFLNGAMSQENSSGAAPISGGAPSYNNNIENEPPLLEELGVNIEHIWTKTKAVILPFKKLHGKTIHLDASTIVEDADLAGPIMFALALGGELMMTGKMHFGFIYGIGLFGCFSMTIILNLMTPKEAISFWTVTSILGYSLLPVNLLAAVKIVLVNLIGLETFGRFLALVAILWSTVASTRLLEVGCGMRGQRYLIGYPIALLYSAFVLMTIF